MRVFIVLAVLAGFLGSAGHSAELSRSPGGTTWRLEKGGEWSAVVDSESEQGRYLLAVAEFKKLVSAGESEAAAEVLAKLKADFEDVIGPDFDAFVEAEMLFARGKFDKAVKSYDRFLDTYAESELYESALERQFQIGTAYLGGQKRKILKLFKVRAYGEGVRIMERIADRAGHRPIAKRALVAAARSYEKRGKFIAGYEKWSEISSLWSTGDVAREALLGMARCMHASYRGPRYDAAGLASARDYYQRFKLEYSTPAEEIGLAVDEILAFIDEQIAYKQYEIGRYYDKTGSRLAANLYYQHVREDWPGSTAARFVSQAEERGSQEAKEQKD